MTCPKMVGKFGVICLFIASVAAHPYSRSCTRNLPYPDPTDCSRFYVCAPWGPQVMNCAPGTEFNAKLHVCDWPYRAGCKVTTSTEASQTTTPNETTEHSSEHYTEPADTTSEITTAAHETTEGSTEHPETITAIPETTDHHTTSEVSETTEDHSETSGAPGTTEPSELTPSSPETATVPETTHHPLTTPESSEEGSGGSEEGSGGNEEKNDENVPVPDEDRDHSETEQDTKEQSREQHSAESDKQEDHGERDTKEHKEHSEENNEEHSGESKSDEEFNPNDICENQPKQGMVIIAHPSDNEKFILCLNGSGVVIDCPEHQIFDKDLNACTNRS